MAQDNPTIEEVRYWEWWNPAPSWIQIRTATGDVILCRDPQWFRRCYDVADGVEVRFGAVPADAPNGDDDASTAFWSDMGQALRLLHGDAPQGGGDE